MCFWSNPETAKFLRETDPTMSMDLFTRALDESAPYSRALCLAGAGEFLSDPLREERLDVLGDSLIRHPQVMFYQTTNASLLTADNLHFLKGVKKVGFTISIDSVDALTYASIRKPGVLAKVEQNIRTLREELHKLGLEEVYLRLNVVLMKRNIFSLPDVLHLAKEINAAVYIDHPQGFGPDNLHQESLFRYPVFTNSYLEKCQKLAETLNVKLHRPPPFAIYPEEIDRYHRAGKDRKLSCYQLDSEGPIQISPNGDVSVCCQNLVFGNLHQQTFKEIFFSPRYNEYRQAIADGHPLSPCDHCRHLYRDAPFLYESSVYDLDIPPESRNLDLEPDFEKEGFFDWMDELSDKELRYHLKQDYLAKNKRLLVSTVSEEIAIFERQKEMNDAFSSWIKDDARVVVYPAAGVAAWMMKHTLLPKMNIVGFSDQNSEMHGKFFCGHPVFSPSDVLSLNPDVFLVASEQFRDKICRDFAYLKDAGVKVFAI
jgi:MoaA/NifB/PqqE/SkfB family radical SAM enzyme